MSGRLRVGLIGARRVRQGLGPFVARDLVAAGAEVVAVLGTQPATASQAAEAIERTAGVRPKASSEPQSFFEELGLDAVCILTPAGTHGAFVEAALAAGLHVLCEKPLLWTPEADWERRVRDFETRFDARGLVLAENAQWPQVLPAYAELVGAPTDGASSLAMGLAPASTGLQMIGDALPHPLSVAQALRPALARAEDIRFEVPTAGSLRVSARLLGEGAELQLSAHLVGGSQRVPREAWLAIDGRRADREIRAEDYALSLRAGDRSVPLPDPLTLQVRQFIESILAPSLRTARGPEVVDRTLSRRAALLTAFAAAYTVAFE